MIFKIFYCTICFQAEVFSFEIIYTNFNIAEHAEFFVCLKFLAFMSVYKFTREQKKNLQKMASYFCYSDLSLTRIRSLR